MRPLIFSSDGRSRGYAADIARERSVAVWKVATIGPSKAHKASTEALGVIGSCRCRTSKSPSASHRFTRAAVTGPKVSRATEPL